MKRIVGLLMAIALLTGAAFTAQRLTSQAPGSNPGASVSNPVAAFIDFVQPDGFSEPVSIMLSSLVLLGSTTLLRRYRMSRRA